MLQEFNKKQKGFTLVEVTVSLMILVIVLTLSMALLFSMQGFARRQRQFAEPRQTARRALDYISGYLRAATDGNYAGGNPNAIVVWFTKDKQLYRATYNNYDPATDQFANLAEPGTDIITIGRSEGGGSIVIAKWPGHHSAAATGWIHFREGCPDRDPIGNDQRNMLKFMQLTGCYGSPNCQTGNFPCNACQSKVLTVVDEYGNWTYMQITSYQQSNCSSTGGSYNFDEIHIVMNPGQSEYNNPGQKDINCPTASSSGIPPNACKIGKNVSYLAFRVMRDQNGVPQLQQKDGIFDPTVDNPGNNFVPLLDNIEDLQIAYIYNDGTIWNDSVNHRLLTTGNVPTQDVNVSLPTDINNVVGLRVSVTAIANTPVPITERPKFFRPESEDRPASNVFDRFYRYRLTNTVMIRNRNLGG